MKSINYGPSNVTSGISAEDLSTSVGYCVYDDGTTGWALADDDTAGDQAAALRRRDICLLTDGGAQSGDQVTVTRRKNDALVVTGASGWSEGEPIILEAGTGKLIGAETAGIALRKGDTILGHGNGSASSSGTGRMDFRPYTFGVAEGAAAAYTMAGDETLSLARQQAAYLEVDPDGAARVLTTRTAAQLITAELPIDGASFTQVFRNTGAAGSNEIIRLAGGSGVTLKPRTPGEIYFDAGQSIRVTYRRLIDDTVEALVERFGAAAPVRDAGGSAYTIVAADLAFGVLHLDAGGSGITATLDSLANLQVLLAEDSARVDVVVINTGGETITLAGTTSVDVHEQTSVTGDLTVATAERAKLTLSRDTDDSIEVLVENFA